MPPTADAFWRLYRSRACPKCGAKEGEACKEPGIRANIWHPERTHDAPRCTTCGDLLPANCHATLCDRCELVRALEVERATKHRRVEP